MDISEARLNTIESQIPTDASHDQKRQRYFSMNKIKNAFCTLCSRGFLRDRGEATPKPIEDTESVPKFIINLKLSDLFDVPGEYVLMNAEMLSKLSGGNEEWLEKLRSHGTPLACLKNDRGDSVLHLAATWGHLELVKSIVSECPCLLLETNFKDQLSSHVAARAGHHAVVEVLVASVAFFSARLAEENRETLNPYLLKDINGDTALSLALKGRYMEVALCLVNGNQQASFLANKDGISPLYLAVEAGNVSLVKEMLGNDGPFEGSNFNLEGRKYLAHAALKLMNTNILDVVLSKCPSLVDERDEEGKTCLSFGASMGNYGGVCKLLDRSTEGVFVCDDDGSYPIHVAVDKGHIAVVMEILKRCPYSRHLLNKKGQNILHIAAESGRFKIILHLRTCQRMALEQDVDGNTPLHLATIKWRPRAVSYLAGTKNLLIQNNSGLTALDVAELNLQPHYIFRERLTLLALAGTYIKNGPRCRHTIKLTRPVTPAGGSNKDYVNALLVVAALIATVTFTAAFTFPGGFKSSTPNSGEVNLITEPSFIFFLISDMVALGSSFVAVICLILAQLGDPALYQSSIWRAMILLVIAIYFMVFAFFYTMAIAAGNVPWLICIIGILVFTVLFYLAKLFLPHVALHGFGINYRVTRLLLANLLKAIDDDETEVISSPGTSL